MLALIYRKSTTWGRAGNRGDLPLALMMFNGESQHSIFGGTTPIEQRLDSFYLVMVPWFRLHGLNIEGFERNGDKTVSTLEGQGNRVEIDWSRSAYSVSFDGAEVAGDSATFCPLGKDRIAMYAIKDVPLTATIPAGWDPAGIAARSLFVDRREPVKFDLEGRKVTVQMEARRPVMIYRDSSMIADAI
jgi:hypothetical protein